MRHRKRRGKLSMRGSQRKAMLRNMVKSLLKYQRIETTVARAKEARRIAEHLITLSKSDTIAARRRAYAILTDRDLVTKLFKEIAPLFKNRTSGYTRIIPIGFRRGDGAELSIFELTEKNIIEKIGKKKEKKKEDKTQTEAAGHTEKTRAPKAEEVKAPSAGEVKKHKEEKPKAMTIPKSKPTFAEEKKTEKAKTEDRKIAGTKNFMKNLRGLFRKRGDR